MYNSINSVKNDVLVIFYKGKKYSINISTELSVNPDVINSQLRQAPSNYAFLCLLRDRAIYKRDKVQRSLDLAYSKAWTMYKESGNVSNDLAEQKAISNSKCMSIRERLDKLNYKVNKLTSICKAYETRDRILQTVSANLRKQ